ncbi:uncharacterized protein [Nicotiana sylvestris]|uniref:uncharacterized protein n=1 Tax=Nicotiana sylvestris TaxID=4096 RepID=UPI00388C9F6A
MAYFGETLTGIASEWYTDQEVSRWHIWDDLAGDFVRVVENLIKQKRIVLKDEDIPNVTNNPLPAHNNGPIIGMICEDKEFDPVLKAIITIADIEKEPKTYAKQEKVDKKIKNPPQNTEKAVETKIEVVVTYKGKEILGEVNETNPTEKYLNLEELNDSTKKRFPLKKPVSAKEAEEFFKKMKTADYEIIDQLRNSPAQVSLWSLLMNSTEHQKVLIKTLNEAYVPIETTVEQLERMAERFFMINQISFSKNDLPPKGAAHNKALHLTVKCEGYYVKSVMLDGGSGVDICPLSTLQRMEIETGRIRPNSVLDMDTSYNFLLGRPWIHATEAIPSTLHQMGLRASLQGITEPITLPAAEKFFGVGFYAEEADVMWANQRKSNGWVLSQPIPHLYRTFFKPKYNEEREDETFMTEEIEEICEVMRQMLYETHMVQPGEGSSTAEELYMGPDAKLQNWKATPFPIKRES